MKELRETLVAGEIDMTLFYRGLSDVDPAAPAPDPLRGAYYDDRRGRDNEPRLAAWLSSYAARVRGEALPAAERRRRMHAANPLYVCRNYLAQQAIDRAADGDYAGIRELLQVLRQPYTEQPGAEAYAARRPDWARNRAGCSMLSCSS